MKKLHKMNLSLSLKLLFIALLFLVVGACSSSTSTIDDEGENSKDDSSPSTEQAAGNSELLEADSNEPNSVETDSAETDPNEETEPVEIELTIVKDEKDEAVAAEIKQEEFVEDAFIFVTDDQFVLATITFNEEISTSEALERGQQYSESLKEKYPEYTIDLEIIKNDQILEQIIID